MEENWQEEFILDGQKFTASFFRRPFREGLEVQVSYNDHTLTVSELGLGESALLEMLKVRLRELIEQD